MYMHMYLIWHILESFKIEQTRVIISEEKKSKPLQVQTTDSIKTALLHPFFILRVVRLQRYGSENQKSKHGLFFFLPYHTTWEFQQQQTKFTHCINSCTVNQICTFIVLAMHFECKYC